MKQVGLTQALGCTKQLRHTGLQLPESPAASLALDISIIASDAAVYAHPARPFVRRAAVTVLGSRILLTRVPCPALTCRLAFDPGLRWHLKQVLWLRLHSALRLLRSRLTAPIVQPNNSFKGMLLRSTP